jgi:hypothetical protein
MPESVTVSRACSLPGSRGPVSTSTVPPGGVNFRALVSRLVVISPDLRAGEALAEGNAGAVEGVGQAVGCVLGDGGKVARDEPELEGGGFG